LSVYSRHFKGDYLICCPSLKAPGGVSNYYRIIKGKTGNSNSVAFFEAGGNAGTGFGIIAEGVTDTFSFIKMLLKSRYRVILLNPSLLPRSILRNLIFLIIARFFRLKVIVFWHGFNLDVADKIKLKWSQVFSALFNCADLTVVLSAEFRERLLNLGIKHSIVVFRTLVDEAQFRTFKIEKKKSDPIRLLFLSRIEKNKGIREAIAAFQVLKKKYPDITFDVVGEGPLLQLLRRFLPQKSGICFHGYKIGVEKELLFKNAQIFVFPSYTEGMPTCVIEAMAFGLPVVTTMVGGLADFFEEGRHGLIAEKKDARSLAKAISILIDKPVMRRKMGKENREYAKKHFYASAAVQELLDFIKQVDSGQSKKLPTFWW